MADKIKNDNYVTILGFMINDLGLKGNELLIYAIIYGFCQDKSSCFRGGLKYLMEWCSASKTTVIKCLKGLEEKGYIIKTDIPISDSTKYCTYKVADLDRLRNCTPSTETEPMGLRNCTDMVQKLNQSGTETEQIGKETVPNNKDIYNNINNINIKNNNKEPKHKYGEYNHVLLTDKEHERLVADFGHDTTEHAIKFLDEYIEEKGYKSKSHNLAIRRWVIDAVTKNNKGNRPNNFNSNTGIDWSKV